MNVSCTNSHCLFPVTNVEVTLPEIAPGVLARPTLLCKACGCELKREIPTGDPMRREWAPIDSKYELFGLGGLGL